MLLNPQSLQSIHRYCEHNRPLLDHSASAGCIHCGATFEPSEIREWVRDEAAPASDATARCPQCGVESVLPSAAPVMLSPALLHAMQQYWFQGK
jgi:DNA-directed RNA polymerase subunit RPC12/RpoP